MTYDNFDLAYIAGFFDGEGCITMSKQTEKPNMLRHNGRSRFALEINITQKSRDTLDWVSLLFGGKVSLHRGNVKFLCHRWRINQRDDQKVFLKAILPFLRLKKKQAEYALQYLDTVRDDGQGQKPLEEEVNQKRHEIHDLLRQEKGHLTLTKALLCEEKSLLKPSA